MIAFQPELHICRSCRRRDEIRITHPIKLSIKMSLALLLSDYSKTTSSKNNQTSARIKSVVAAQAIGVEQYYVIRSLRVVEGFAIIFCCTIRTSHRLSSAPSVRVVFTLIINCPIYGIGAIILITSQLSMKNYDGRPLNWFVRYGSERGANRMSCRYQVLNCIVNQERWCAGCWLSEGNNNKRVGDWFNDKYYLINLLNRVIATLIQLKEILLI